MNDRRTESVPFDGPAQMPLAQASGTVLARRYELDRVLGIGGSSIVYRAIDRVVGKTVALKLLRRDRMSPAAVARLRREVAVTRNVAGAHLVRVFDIGSEGDDTFITMELVEGESLRARLQRGPLAVEEAIDIARQLLEALAVLHAQQIVHRDIKPSNVLIDAGGCVKLADFGLAVDPAAQGDRPTQAGTLVGTAEYMSPEQVFGRPLDARSDLYSFGVLLYECLTGELPFGEKSSVAALVAHVHERPRLVRSRRRDVPVWLSRLLDILLEKDARRRLGSADAVLATLAAERAPRNWRPFASAAAVVLIVTAAAAAIFAVLRQPAVSGIRPAVEGGIEAVDRRGGVLWRNAAFPLATSAAVHQRDGSVTVVAAKPRGGDPRERALNVLDVRSGAPVAVVRTFDPAPYIFPTFADLYSTVSVKAVELDGDGDEEVATTYTTPYWPSYTVVYDLSRRAERLLFANSGGHMTRAVADVNGDGRRDLLVSGVNNRMGWYSFVAALDVPPVRAYATSSPQMVTSPDAVFPNTAQRRVLWYVLLPPQHETGEPRIDLRTRSIAVPLTTGETIRLTSDGFIEGVPNALPPAQRSAEREAAYATLREADRSYGSHAFTDAVRHATDAAAAAHRAGDPYLEEWCRRVRVKDLVRAGDVHEAEKEAEALLAADRSAADVAWDIARELHLSGRLERAVAWYRRGLFNGREPNSGRLKYEFVQGAVLALAELNRFDDASALLDQAEHVFTGMEIDWAQYRNYIRWRRGETAFLSMSPLAGDPDLRYYWQLEFRHAAGEPAAALLTQIEQQQQRTEFSGLVLSIKSALLEESGAPDQARRDAASALDWTQSHADGDTVARAHLALVRERARRLGVATAVTGDTRARYLLTSE